MFEFTPARVHVRVLLRTAAFTAAISIGVVMAYSTSGAVEHAMANARAQRLADAAAQGFSEAALREQGSVMSPGALAVAQRHDALAEEAGAPDRQAAQFADALERRALRTRAPLTAQPAVLRRVSAPNGALNGARQLDCLSQAVYYEARGETPSGQAAVAQVVLNRVRHPAFPKSICAVVFQGAGSRTCQFSFACDGSLHRTRERGAWRRAQKVAARVLDGAVLADVGSATHFHAARVGPQWPGMIRVAQVGLHVFYKFGGRAAGGLAKPRPQVEPSGAVYASMLPVGGNFLGVAAQGATKIETAAAPAPVEVPEHDLRGAEPAIAAPAETATSAS